jgi:hypothetical protein
MKIIDIPQKHSIEAYKSAIEKQVDYFSKIDGVKSIYQIGGVSTPGISDIDLIIVFKDDFSFKQNPRIVNNQTANYLFTHSLYGISESDFSDSIKYTFFHNHILLYGEHIELINNLSQSDQLLLKQQIALEFLVKMYVNLGVQNSYKIIKLRSIFLHIKALKYDFEFLNIQPKPLLELVDLGVTFRNSWFDGKVNENDIKTWFKHLFEVYETFLETLLYDFKFYSTNETFKVGPNINMSTSNAVGYTKKGIVFPDMFNLFDKKHVKLLNRFNSFYFSVNAHSDVPLVIQDYFKYAEKTNQYNKLYLPYFMPLTSSLKMY